MRKHMWAVGIAALVVVFGLLVLAVPSARAGDEGPKVIPPESRTNVWGVVSSLESMGGLHTHRTAPSL